MISPPDIPDWIIEGMRVMEEHEVLQARARAAWRRHCAHEAQRWSWAAHRMALRVGRFQEQVRKSRRNAAAFPKARHEAAVEYRVVLHARYLSGRRLSIARTGAAIMAKDSKIEWTHHTFNPWWGCEKVSAACKHCYAQTWANRLGLDLWGGKRSDRRFFSDQHWKEPLKWNRDAEREGSRRRVFCASMADVFEPRSDLNEWRERLWLLIEETPFLDWLLLTKRIEHVESMVPWKSNWPANVWLGTTIENQEWADKRLPHLRRLKAKVKFVSCEPLLGHIDIRKALAPSGKSGINWVIAGGESGPGARPMNPAWAESLRDQCQERGAAFHFKQWGHWGPQPRQGKTVDVVEFKSPNGVPIKLFKLGKNEAGRVLDGQTWDQFPQ